MLRSPFSTVIIASSLIFALLVPAAASAARPSADLRVTKTSKAPKQARQGARVKLGADTVRNVGNRRAAATSVRYYLTTNVARSLADRRSSRLQPAGSYFDVRLVGSRSVPTLAAGASNATPKGARKVTSVRIPADAAPGTYTLLVCADDRAVVVERSESNNCTAAKGKVRVVEVAQDLEVRALMDYDVDAKLSAEDILAALTQAQAYCLPAGQRPRSMAKLAAMKNIRRVIEQQIGKSKVRALTKQLGKRPADAQRRAVAAVSEGAPAAGLLAMLHAHELAPKEASHLVGAAGIATSLGFHQEALALLDAAEQLDDVTPSGFGISSDVAALHNRGAALLALRRYDDALQLFEAVLERQPLVTESAQGAVSAATCARKLPRAVMRFGKAKKRSTSTTPPGPMAQPVTGTPAALPTLVVPPGPSAAEQYKTLYQQLSADSHERFMVAQRRQTEIRALRRARADATLTTKFQDAVVRSAYDEILGAEMKPIRALAVNGIKEAHRFREIKWCVDMAEGATGCDGHQDVVRDYACGSAPAARWNAEHTALLEKSYQQKLDAYQREVAIAYGHAALVDDPLVRELIMLIPSPHLSMGGIWQAGEYWTSEMVKYSVSCPIPQEQIPYKYDPGSDEDPAGCDKAAQRLSFVLDVKVLAVKVNCAAVTVTADSSVAFLGMLGVFGEFSYNHGKGELTIVAGAKGGVTYKGNGADLKSGVYTTVTKDGISDVGMRVSPSYGVSTGMVEYSNPSDMDFTFLAKP